MSEELATNTEQANEVLKMIQLTALNVNAMSEQMGLLRTKVNDISDRMVLIENRMQGYEDKVRLTREQQTRIKAAIHSRVSYLLGINRSGGVTRREDISKDVKYKSGFIRRCYHDARTHSRLGTPYQETYQRDFEECIRYIESWLPEVTFEGESGVEAYKKYLDIRDEEKNEK